MDKTLQQARIDNITYAEKGNKEYFKRIRIRDYIAGQAIYNLGDYPERISAQPTEYDKKLIKQLAESGVKLIQLHEEWNDPVRIHGGDKFNAVDPEGLKSFIALCHENGIKVLGYASSGFFQETDPDYKEEYSKSKEQLISHFFRYRKASHSSAAWREFIIPKVLGAMDEYGFDGLFNDIGYDRGDKFEDWYDPHVEDVLCQIYSEVKKRGGIYKVHCDCNNPPPCKDKIYDYVWVGECVDHFTAGIGKEWHNYVVPCLDRRYIDSKIDTYMAYTVPFLQFPLLKTGRFLRGKNGNVPGVEYYGGGEQEFYRRVEKYMDEHPDGPYVYSLWSPIPDDPDEFSTWARYFKLYEPMVTENSLCYMELRNTEAIASPLNEKIYASMFVNESIYLVLSNLTDEPYTLKLNGKWLNRMTGEVSDSFVIQKETLAFFVKE